MVGFFGIKHVELQRTFYDNPLLLDASLQVDEDNRNALIVSLARTLGQSWEIEGRYSLYVQEFGNASDYRRQTIFLALGYIFDND